MTETSIELQGFIFDLAGRFFINPIKSIRKYKWQENKVDRYEHISTCIEFIEEGTDQRQELAYIITVDDEIKYVGEYSKTLRLRWLKVDNYIWHHKDHLIFKALKQGCKVSLWLVNNPTVSTASGEVVNISKSIEHHILKNNLLEWNKRNNKSI